MITMNNTTEFIADEASMLALGAKLATRFSKKNLILLEGDLGTGKTTLVRGILREMGYQGTVKSPTYTLVEPYSLQNLQLYHFDLYRLGDPEELEYMGIRDYFDENTLCLIEWPEKAANFLPPADLRLQIEYADKGIGREISYSSPKKY